MKKNLLIIKWGRAIKAFTPEEKNRANLGRSFDIQIEYLVDLYRNNYNIGLGIELKNKEGKLPEDCFYVDKFSPLFNPDFVIVLGGPNRIEFNQPWIDFLNNLDEKIPIIVYANDMRFTQLEGVTRKYSVKNETKVGFGQFASNSKVNAYVALNHIRKFRPKKVIVQANENDEDSRLEVFAKYVENNPEIKFYLYGEYRRNNNLDILSELTSKYNIEWYGRNLNYKQLYELYSSGQFDFGLIIPMKWKEVQKEVYENWKWPENYIPFKFYEFVLNGIMPIFDFTQKNHPLPEFFKKNLKGFPLLYIEEDYSQLTKIVEKYNDSVTLRELTNWLKKWIKTEAENVSPIIEVK